MSARTPRKRYANDPATSSIPISYGGGDQAISRCRAFYIGTAGNLVVQMADDPAGTNTTLSNLLAGNVYWFSVVLIKQTGSTAAGVVLY